MQHFNPIQSKWFGVAILCIMVQNVLVLISLKSKENIIFAHSLILIQNTNQASHCCDLQSSIFSLSLGLDTLLFLQ